MLSENVRKPNKSPTDLYSRVEDFIDAMTLAMTLSLKAYPH